MIQDTSTAALKTVDKVTDEILVFQELEKGVATDLELCDRLGWSINRITGRRNKLVNLGKVKKMYKKQNPSGRWAIVWGVNHD